MEQPTFLDALKGTFGVKKEEPQAVTKPIETVATPKKYNTYNSIERTLGDPTVSGAAQRIFNPNQNVVPMAASQVKAPSAPMVNKGTASTVKDEGWGSTK